MLEKETAPPAIQTLQNTAPTTIGHQGKPQTGEIMLSPIIMRPTTLPPSPDSLPTKKPRIKSLKYMTRQPTQYFHIRMGDEYPLHEKYDLQDIHTTTYKLIIEATWQPREGEDIRNDLLAFFIYHWENKILDFHQGAKNKYYDGPWYSYKEMLKCSTGIQQTNTAYWYNILEQSCLVHLREGKGPSLLRLVPPSYIGKTNSVKLVVRGPGWGHPTGCRVKTPSRHPGEETPPTPFLVTTDMLLASVSYSLLKLSTETHCAVEINTH